MAPKEKMCMLSRGQPLWRVRKNKTNTLHCQNALWYMEEWSETKGKEETAVGRSLPFSLKITLACTRYHAELKHVSTSGPGLLYIKDVSLCAGRSQGRIYLELRHLSQPSMCADLQNCINDTTKSFKKVCGAMQYDPSMLRRSEWLFFRWNDADLFIQQDLSPCQRHFNWCCWHAEC